MRIFNFLCLLCFSFVIRGQDNADIKTFENKTTRFLSTYVINGFVDYASIKETKNELDHLVASIGNMDLTDFDDLESKAFYINAYNLLVIDQIIKNYPSTSVKEISGFFDRSEYLVGKLSLTLNEIEKDILLKEYKDSRFHFALVCGAKDCPKLWSHSFTSDKLDEQLDARTKAALNDTFFLRETANGYALSEIFRWNRFEFGGKNEILEFINTYRDLPLESESKISYYNYDWTLNDIIFKESSTFNPTNNSFRYITSAAIPEGGIEVKVFNNLYTQKTIEGPIFRYTDRSTYFTTSISFLYGLNNRFNIGFSSRYRRVRNTGFPSSAFDIFQSSDQINSKQGLTAFGPQIRWAPIKSWSNFSIQSSLTFPLSKNLSGGVDTPFLDWGGPVFLTQFFNDKAIGTKLSLFTEIDVLIEEIGGAGKSNRTSIPVTGIVSWFPKKNLTIYGLLGVSPYLVKPFDYFLQVGLGLKFQLTRSFEIELLVTDFSNRFLYTSDGNAATYNIGFRYSKG